MRDDEYHLLAYFLSIISYVQLPGSPLVPGSVIFLVQGLFLQPSPGAPVTLRALSREQGGMPSWFTLLRSREAFSLHTAVGSGVAIPGGDLVPNPHGGFCSRHLAQWEEVLGERTSKS